MLRYKTKTRPGLVALYDIQPGNEAGPFLQPRSPHGAMIPGQWGRVQQCLPQHIIYDLQVDDCLQSGYSSCHQSTASQQMSSRGDSSELPRLWLLNSPDLSPTDCTIWVIIQQRVQSKKWRCEAFDAVSRGLEWKRALFKMSLTIGTGVFIPAFSLRM